MPAEFRGHLVALLGATASGKTAAAVHVARSLPIEVVSADSRQIRRGMRIGTAAPSDDELAAVPHHLVGIVEPDAPWTLADFLERSHAAIEDIWSRGRLPLLVGGTGQYVWALLEGWRVPAVPPNPGLRADLEVLAANDGNEAVRDRLAAVDPASAERVDMRNLRRLVRALEIVEATGRPVEPLRREPPPWTWSAVGLSRPREELYARVDARAAAMYRDGLVAETAALIERFGPDFDALRSVGYAEAARVVADDWDQAAALERTKTETHRLIRQQGTWFRADDERVAWVDASNADVVTAAVEAAARAPVR